MSKHSEYEIELQKRFEEVGEIDEYISLLLYAIFDGNSHNMLIEEESQKDFYEQVPQSIFDEISAFEKVDLYDYWKLVNSGRTDKKR